MSSSRSTKNEKSCLVESPSHECNDVTVVKAEEVRTNLHFLHSWSWVALVQRLVTGSHGFLFVLNSRRQLYYKIFLYLPTWIGQNKRVQFCHYVQCIQNTSGSQKKKKCIECRRRRAGCDVGVVKCSQIVSSNSSSCLRCWWSQRKWTIGGRHRHTSFWSKREPSLRDYYAHCGKIIKYFWGKLEGFLLF